MGSTEIGLRRRLSISRLSLRRSSGLSSSPGMLVLCGPLPSRLPPNTNMVPDCPPGALPNWDPVAAAASWSRPTKTAAWECSGGGRACASTGQYGLSIGSRLCSVDRLSSETPSHPKTETWYEDTGGSPRACRRSAQLDTMSSYGFPARC
eukprot:scaffold23201_cov108-Isochrysis_galbana.AAC.3